MDRKLIWKYLDKLVEKQNIDMSRYWPVMDCPFGWLAVYLELERRGLVVVYTDGEHESVQVYLTDEGLHVYRRMLAARIDRKHHALAYRIRRMRRYHVPGYDWSTFDGDLKEFYNRNRLYIVSRQEREAAKALATPKMIRLVEAYEDNPMFDPLYKREHIKAYQEHCSRSMPTEIKVTHGTLMRHLRDLKGSRLP